MKKLISVCLVAALVFSLFTLLPLSLSAAEPGKLIDFYYEDLYNDAAVSQENECLVNWKNNSLYFKASTAASELKDPYFSLAAGSDFQTEDHPWMVIKLKNLSDITTFEMHYGTSIHAMNGAAVVHFDIKAKDSDYQTYVVNIPEANLATAYPLNGPGGIAEQAGSTTPPIDKLSKSTWEGTLTTLRFDCLYKDGASGNVPDGAEMYIEYAAFFSSEDDAKAFAKSGPDRSNYVAPPTAAPIPEEDAKPNYDAVIIFKEDGDWEDYIAVDSGPFNGVSYSEFNEAGDGIVYSVDEVGDPWATMQMLASVDAEEWPIMQVKIKREAGTPTTGTIYWATTQNNNLAEAQTSNVKYQDTAEWQIVNVNMNEKKNGLCVGDYTMIRFDMFGSSPKANDFEIGYIAFFKSIEAAKQYIEKGGDFSEVAAATPAPTEKATAAPTPAAKTNDVKSPSPSSSVTTPAEKSNTKVIIIVVAAVVVAAGVVIAIVLVNKKKKKQ